MPTFKVSTVANGQIYLAYFLGGMMTAIDFYGLKRWRRTRWKTQIAQQRTFDKMCKAIRGDTAVERAIAFEDGNVNLARGRPKVPVKGLFRELRRRYGKYVRKLDKDYTSQMCSLCDGWFGDDQRLYYVKTCKSVCLVRVSLIDCANFFRWCGIATSMPLEIFAIFSCTWKRMTENGPKRSVVAKQNNPF